MKDSGKNFRKNSGKNFRSNFWKRSRLPCCLSLALALAFGIVALKAPSALSAPLAADPSRSAPLAQKEAGVSATSGSGAAKSPLRPRKAESLSQPSTAGAPFETHIEQQIGARIAAQQQTEYPIFGYTLFSGRYSTSYADTRNPDYIVSAGDIVTISLWGGVSSVHELEVDAQGVVFVPDVGPVKVGGVRSADLNREVQAQIARSFNDTVNVYTNLQGATPVNIFVTGYAVAPGRYEGGSSDSVLYFLNRAGGIDPDRGSLRDIEVMRGGKPAQHVDLYDFFLKGVLPSFYFRDGDTIVVRPRGGLTQAGGAVMNVNSFELSGPVPGARIIELARPRQDVSHVQVTGVRNGERTARYTTIAAFADETVQPGDQIDFIADIGKKRDVIAIEGTHSGPLRLVVPEGTTLNEVLRQIPVDGKRADLDAIYLKRASVAAAQKQSLQQSTERLERSLVRGEAVTPEQAEIQSKEAELVRSFIDRIRDVQPEGRVALGNSREKARAITLEDGDVIVLPEKTDLVFISGEVFAPQAIVYKKGASANYYITSAGGVSERGDKGRIVVRAHNGAFIRGEPDEIKPGDEILVLPRLTSQNLELAKAITDITYKLVLSTVLPISVILNNDN